MNYAFGQPQQVEKRKVFVSFHSADQAYRDEFDRLFGDHFISMSVDRGDIDPENETEYIKRMIQQEHIVQSSVVIALYGKETYKRKHVDWEISGGLSGKVGGHKGLIIILLPEFPVWPFDALGQFNQSLLHPYLHPRTATNVNSGYAAVHSWPGMYPQLPAVFIGDIVEGAANRRETHNHLIDNSHEQYKYNLA